MRKPVTPSPFAKGTTNRFGRSRLGHGFSASNSNARVSPPYAPALATPAATGSSTVVNMGLNSERSRGMMVHRLRHQGIHDVRVLNAFMAVPPHALADPGLPSRAYEDAAMPIGYAQQLSPPLVVARMFSAFSQTLTFGHGL